MTTAAPRVSLAKREGRSIRYRYIIVGAGSAGCVLADRLSADPSNEVLLLEAGGRDINPLIHIPAGISRLVHNPRINWHYYTEEEPELHDRKLYWPRGKVFGGSSSINAMCYVRGQREDYDGWAGAGNRGWDFASVFPYFIRSERQSPSSRLDGSPFHGSHGKVCVEDLRFPNPLSRTFVDAAVSIGARPNDDFNGAQQEGVGLYQVTQCLGRRCSSAVAYLRAARSRPNLTVLSHSLAQRLVIERKRAVGVEVLRRRRLETYFCDGEVVLCSGAVNTPQLLLLSGIGPPEELIPHGIATVAPLAGVGANLQDHLDICLLQKCTQPITYDFSLADELKVALRYLSTRAGPAASNVAEAGGFLRSPYARGERPDVQLHFVPAQLDDHGRNRLPGHGYTLHACNLHPESRGTITLRSARAMDPPRIHANYLQRDQDLRVMIAALEIGREILAATPFDAFRGLELYPGKDVRTHAAMADFIRGKSETVYHPAGTCRMGVDENAVVDPQLRVYGIDGLRVADASIMPTLVSGNTNAPTMMIAEKAADMILLGSSTREAATHGEHVRTA